MITHTHTSILTLVHFIELGKIGPAGIVPLSDVILVEGVLGDDRPLAVVAASVGPVVEHTHVVVGNAKVGDYGVAVLVKLAGKI